MADTPDGSIVIGIALATGTVRCVALDAWTGDVLASVSTSLAEPARSPEGHSTQEPGYAATALGLVARVVGSLGASANRIRAISATGTSGTVVPLDASGHPVGRALLADDTSGNGLAAAHGLPDDSMLGRMASAMGSACAGGASVARLASTADVVHAALVGGLVAADTSHLLEAGIDPEARTWPRATITLGLEGLVPTLLAPGSVLGVVSADCSLRLGLRADVLVVAGMTIRCTAQIATGATHLRDSVGVLDTTLSLMAVAGTEVTSPDGAVRSHRAPDGAWWAGATSNVGAGAFAAYRSGMTTRELAVLGMRAARRGPATVVCYPLARSGERFPVAEPSLQALWSGRPADDVEAHRAILEGVAFVERLGLETLGDLGAPSRRHVLAGDGSRSTVWAAIRATLLAGRDVSLAGRGDSATGAAVLAAVGLGREPFGQVVHRLVDPPRPVEVTDAEIETLEASYATFLRLVAMATGRDGGPPV